MKENNFYLEKFKAPLFFKVGLLISMIGIILFLVNVYERVSYLETKSTILEAAVVIVAREKQVAYLLENIDEKSLEQGLAPLFDVQIEPMINNSKKSRTAERIILITGMIFIIWIFVGIFLPSKKHRLQ